VTTAIVLRERWTVDDPVLDYAIMILDMAYYKTLTKEEDLKTVYLAAQFARRDELAVYAAKLRSAGWEVTSSWLDQTTPLDGKMSNHLRQDNYRFASRDWEDVRKADHLVLFTEDPLVGVPRGARHVEFGMALASGKAVAIVGPRENVFHWLLPDNAVHLSFNELLSSCDRVIDAFWSAVVDLEEGVPV
jgi:hypothetical protein